MASSGIFRPPYRIMNVLLKKKRCVKVVVSGYILMVIIYALGSITDTGSPPYQRLPPQQRRIQQALLRDLTEGGGWSTSTGFNKTFEEKVIQDNNYSLPILQVPIIQDSYKYLGLTGVEIVKTAKGLDVLKKAQLTAVAMKEAGMKLTAYQENLLKGVSGQKKEELVEKLKKMRRDHEEHYMSQIRAQGLIERLPSGGERVLSTPYKPIRFPTTLKKLHPQDWELNYKVFGNLTHYPWSKTPSCMDYHTTFAAPSSLPTAALASFPSSGNTWIRYLIDSGSGIFTGSFYDDSSLTRKGLYGEGLIYDSGMTLLQKTHGYTTGEHLLLPYKDRVNYNHMEELNYHGVVVIRNPFKALISHRHLDVGGHTGYAPKSHFIGTDWKNFVHLKITLWKEFYSDWLRRTKPKDILVVLYEDLRSDPLIVIRKILNFLHRPIDEKRLRCLAQHPDGQFKRKPRKNLTLDINPFTRDLKDQVYQAIDELNQVLLDSGKGPLPLERYEVYDAFEAKISRDRRRELGTA